MVAAREGTWAHTAPVSREESRRAIGPILAVLFDASRNGAPSGTWREALKIGPPGNGRNGMPGSAERAQASKGRMGIHGLVCLVKLRFCCAGLDGYEFAISPRGGVYSPRLDAAIDALDSVEGANGVNWDGDGRFVRLVRRHCADPEWLSIAALICLLRDALLEYGDTPRRDELVEWTHRECRGFALERIGEVHDELREQGLLELPSPPLQVQALESLGLVPSYSTWDAGSKGHDAARGGLVRSAGASSGFAVPDFPYVSQPIPRWPRPRVPLP